MWRELWSGRSRRRRDSDLDEELQAHLAIEAAERIADGATPEEATGAARRVFGNITSVKEDTRDAWGWTPVEEFFDDVRHGVRMLRKTPGWTSVVIGTLGVGIGLITAVFSLVYGVVLQPLPYPAPERLVALWSSAPAIGLAKFHVGAADWQDWRTQARSFEDIALTRPIANFNLIGDGAPERLQGARSSWNLSAVLGLKPLVGRMFTEEEQVAGANVAVLSYGLWQRRFGRDPGVVGRTIQLNGAPYEVVGVMPAEFQYPAPEFELWTPLYIPPQEIADRLGHDYIAVARMKPGVTRAEAQAEMSVIMRRLNERYPAISRALGADVGVTVEGLLDSVVATVKPALYALFAAVSCLLLIGCVNLGNLLLVRSATRSREMGVRAALGASARRLRRQVLAEVLPVGVGGAVAGILLAWWFVRAMAPFLTAMPRANAVGLQAPVLAFAVCVSFAVVVAGAMLPARVAARWQLTKPQDQESRTVAGGSGLRNGLVAGQVAVTLVLLFGAALLIRSMAALLAVNPGFATDGVLTMHLAVTRARHPSDRDVAAYCQRVLDRVAAVPGVTAAGMVNRLPLSGIAQTGPVEFEGRPGAVHVDWRSATPGYLSAMGIPVSSGRAFTVDDREDAPQVGIIDEQLAKQFFPNRDALGKRFRITAGNIHGPWTEIVGIAGHIRNDGLDRDVRPQVYWPLAQRTQDRVVLVVKTAGVPESFTPAVIEQIHREEPEQPVYDVRTMSGWLDRSLRERKLLTTFVCVFGGAALLLACLGVYGVLSYTTGLRMREFGIRLALGSDPAAISRLVLAYAGRVAMIGVAAGLLLTWPAGRALRGLLYGVGTADAVAMLAAPCLLTAVALAAAWIPARRAARVDPAVTLRAE